MSEHIIKASELRKLNDEELKIRLDEFKKELFNLRFQHHTDILENPSRIKHVKRNIARILTILRERELAREQGESKE